MSKSELAIMLSKLNAFKDAKVRLEQYPTDSEIAAGILWNAYLAKDIEGKTIADLGCGTGILGIGALILGAKKVYFVDTDEDAVRVAIENLKKAEKEAIILGEAVFLSEDIADFSEKADTVITNPPFGTRRKGADLQFLEKAFKLAGVIYSFHKAETKEYLRKFIERNGFAVTSESICQLPLKMSMRHHKKPVKPVSVVCFRLLKQQNKNLFK